MSITKIIRKLLARRPPACDPFDWQGPTGFDCSSLVDWILRNTEAGQ